VSLVDYDIGETVEKSDRTLIRRARRRSDGSAVLLQSLVKVYPPPHEAGQIEFEYRILRKLEGPGVIRALGLERDADRVLMVLEDAGGERLPRCVAGEQGFARFFPIAALAVRALGHVHSRGVIHLDVEPRNLLWNSASGEVTLIDFSVASELAQEHRGADVDQPFEGSPPYMSPEQTGRMNRDVDYRSDYYSLGVTLFELLTGELPFSAPDPVGWVHCHLSKRAPDARQWNPAVPEMLAQIVRKLMSKDPDDRYQSAHGILHDLERCEHEWAARREVSHFALGQRDVPERFQVSQKLFGRQNETAMLMEAFEAASTGPAKLLLVSGPSGVGKSSLIREIHKPVVGRRGKFVAGKFDQLDRNVPYGALLQGVRGLLRQLLAEPEDRLQFWRETIGAAIDPNGQVLANLLPELEKVMGPQAPVPELPPREALARLHRVFREFIRAVARPDHPLVVFIDDLQWADASTPGLLVHLLSDPELKHLLVIGTYRDTDVVEGHLVHLALAELAKQRPEAVLRIELLPLAEASVNDLVADTLRCDPAASVALGRLVAEKTAGNPFFVKELLAMLYRDGAFGFVAGEGHWQWDVERVAAAAVTDNVVDLMVQRLNRLSTATIECLRFAACIGGEFDLRTLIRVGGKPAGEVAAAMREAVGQRVVVPLDGSYRLVYEGQGSFDEEESAPAIRYRFQHDRVQQAVYSLLDGPERARVHSRIGRQMLAAAGDPERSERLFDIVNHLDFGRELVGDYGGRAELFHLNELAAMRARRSAAYGVAASYFDACLGLFTAEEWASEPQRFFECRLRHAECIYLSGQIERANALSDDLVALAANKADAVSAYVLKARVLAHQDRLRETIDTIRRGLRLLDIELPENPAEIQRRVDEGIGKMQAHLGRTRIEDLARLPDMVDEDKKMAMDLLFRLIPAAVQADPPLFDLAVLVMFDLALSHGVTPISCKNFIDCGKIHGRVLGDYEAAYRLGKVALELLARYAPTPLEASVHFAFAAFASHWRVGYREGLAHFAIAEQKGIEMGETPHAGVAFVIHSLALLQTGQPLDEVDAFCEHSALYLKKAQAVTYLMSLGAVRRAVAWLRGNDADPAIAVRDSGFADQVTSIGSAPMAYFHGESQLMVNILLGDYAAAARWLAFTAPYLPSGAGMMSLPDYHLFESLVAAKKWARASDAERASILDMLTEKEKKLRIWAEGCPENFEHKHKILLATVARLRGAPADEIADLYDKAATSAGGSFIHMRALVSELQAELWSDRRLPNVARSFVQEAYYLYERWGAHRKLRQLERLHPWLGAMETATSPGTSSRKILRDNAKATAGGALDIASLVKATQAISSEVKPDRLFAQVMKTIIESAGAERGCLIVRSDASGELLVEATAHVGEEAREGRLALRIDDCGELCADIVRYVVRTSEPVVIGDAFHDPRYGEDLYVRKNAVKSVLCVPVSNQGKLVAVLYAENNAATHAFTSQRVGLLQVIASQAAISITNARAYDRLEEEVAKRTRELTDRNREVVVMLHSMQQGIFTIDEHLVIQPQYSAYLEHILGRRDIAGKDSIGMLLEGSSISEDAIVVTRSALLFSFGSPVFLAEINWPHLVKEFSRTNTRGETRWFEVDWNPIVGEDNAIHKILVAVRDVTVLHQLRATMAHSTRELDLVGEILEARVATFRRFAEATHASMREAASALRTETPATRAALTLALSHVHTVKGNAGMLGLGQLVDAVHAAEDLLIEPRADRALAPDRDKLLAGIDAILASLAEYEDVCRRKLGEAEGEAQTQRAIIDEIGAAVAEGLSGAAGLLPALKRIEKTLSRTEIVALRDLVKESTRMLPVLARELGKPTPLVECTDEGVELTVRWAEIMRGVLAHALRNSLDHGIEAADERLARNKTPEGRIRVHGRRAGDRIVVRVSDDGRGLRLAALREKTGDANAADEEVAAAAFRSGVSTAARVSRTSGRGIGLDAIRSFVDRNGGKVRIAFTAPSRRDGCRPFELVIELPHEAGVAEARRHDARDPLPAIG
jgi:predicted ATPase/HPt (histidine-containing phosphotransfer) domain-containing protein